MQSEPLWDLSGVLSVLVLKVGSTDLWSSATRKSVRCTDAQAPLKTFWVGGFGDGPSSECVLLSCLGWFKCRAGATGPWTTDWGVTDSDLGSVMGPSIVCSRFQCYPDHTGVRLLTCYTELRHECTENALLFTVTHIQIAMNLLFNFILQLNLGTREKCCSWIHFYWCIFIKKTEPRCKECVL